MSLSILRQLSPQQLWLLQANAHGGTAEVDLRLWVDSTGAGILHRSAGTIPAAGEPPSNLAEPGADGGGEVCFQRRNSWWLGLTKAARPRRLLAATAGCKKDQMLCIYWHSGSDVLVFMFAVS